MVDSILLARVRWSVFVTLTNRSPVSVHRTFVRAVVFCCRVERMLKMPRESIIACARVERGGVSGRLHSHLLLHVPSTLWLTEGRLYSFIRCHPHGFAAASRLVKDDCRIEYILASGMYEQKRFLHCGDLWYSPALLKYLADGSCCGNS